MQSGARGQTQGCLSPLPPAKEPDIRVSDNGRGQMVPVPLGRKDADSMVTLSALEVAYFTTI